MEAWLWFVTAIGTAVFASEFIGRLTPLGSISLWLWRQGCIMWWKHKKTWPIKVEFADAPLKIVCHFTPDYLDVEANIIIKVRDRKSEAKIDQVQIELIGNNSSYEENEWDPVLTNKPLKDVVDGSYTINFEIRDVLNPYFAEWSKGNIPMEDVFGIVKLRVGKLLCETKPSLSINRSISA